MKNSFSPVDMDIFPAVLSFYFRDSRELVIESVKKSYETSPLSANLAYWTGNDGLMKFLLSWLMV